MAVFIAHESCPACGSRDNLARYDDGSAWCFGCGHYERARRFRIPANTPKRALERFYPLVDTLPPANKDWLLKYGLNEHEISFFKYNPKTDRHVYEILGQDGSVAYYEERAVDGRSPKTMSHGNKPIHVLESRNELVQPQRELPSFVVVVEDIVSALRVARQARSLPLFGSKVPKDWWPYLTGITKALAFWLDYDKYPEAVKQSTEAKLRGFTSFVVRTREDPKELSDAQIKEVLDTLR